MNHPEPPITQGALAQLISYDWPGNVAERNAQTYRGTVIAASRSEKVRSETPIKGNLKEA